MSKRVLNNLIIIRVTRMYAPSCMSLSSWFWWGRSIQCRNRSCIMSLIIRCTLPQSQLVWVKYINKPIHAALPCMSLLSSSPCENLVPDYCSWSYRMTRTRFVNTDIPGTSQGGANMSNPPPPPSTPTLTEVIAHLFNTSADNTRIL
jgi:hypothetical protein